MMIVIVLIFLINSSILPHTLKPGRFRTPKPAAELFFKGRSIFQTWSGGFTRWFGCVKSKITLLMRNSVPLGPDRRTMPRALRWS